MPESSTSYLVAHDENGFGSVYPLEPKKRYVAGRAPENAIVLLDDLCSRKHAEFFQTERTWMCRDLGSLNGTVVNDARINNDAALQPRDTVKLGQTQFWFVDSLQELPTPPSTSNAIDPSPDALKITKRLNTTKYLIPPTLRGGSSKTADTALKVLYQLAVAMAKAQTPSQLGEIVLDSLLANTPTEFGVLIALTGNDELEELVQRTRLKMPTTYHRGSKFVSREVIANKQAILAEDVSSDRHLKNRESLTELAVTSLICAPIIVDDRILGLLHLYRINGSISLNADDLEFVLAVAYQLGGVWAKLTQSLSLTRENDALRKQLGIESELIGHSSAMQQVEEQIRRVALTKATVLIRGESGVGKELVARAIHASSPRRDHPLICLNCAALTETLLESELFGHEKGSFTGATDRLIGKFESAHHGTIFLDEIGEMSVSTQAKLLRVLEGQPFERVGGNRPIQVDVRVVVATNRSLEEAVRDNSFRRDLYFRLQVIQIDVPPLRERPDDIPVLAEHFVQRFLSQTGRKLDGLTPEAVTKLVSHDWPGNVRELRNVIERAVTLSVGPSIAASDIWLTPLGDIGLSVEGQTYSERSLQEIERDHIQATLEHTDWNKSRTASILGIERSTLDRKIKTYNLRK